MINYITSSFFFLLFFSFYYSCSSNLEPCEIIICENDGTCDEGICDCPPGRLGVRCERFDPSKVQQLLDEGIPPLELLQKGISKNDFYGLKFQDGLIYYISDHGTGFVVTEEDLGEAPWGCDDKDILDLPKVDKCPDNCLFPEPINFEPSARIGDGIENTNKILADCNQEGIAARLCRNHGDEWHLPARESLYLMYKNLYRIDKGNLESYYWSSTQASQTPPWAWQYHFQNGQTIYMETNKFRIAKVRAIKAF